MPVSKTSLPRLSDVRQSFNDLLKQSDGIIRYDDVPSYMSYFSKEVTHAESFNKIFQVHADVNAIKFIAEAKFDYTYVKNTLSTKRNVLIKVRQMFYNISVDPKAADQWGELQNIGDYEPVYVSSVDYGRVAYFLVESDFKAEEISKIFQASVNAKFVVGSANTNAIYVETVRKLFAQKKIKVFTAGGPLSLRILIVTKVLWNFLKHQLPKV